MTVQPLKNVAFDAVHQRAAADADAGRVLHLRGHQVPLIEVRRRPLGVEIAASPARSPTPLRLTPVNAPASSVAFASVYCTVAVRPLRSRRRS